MQKDVLKWLDDTAVRYSDKTAVVDENGSITWGGFRNKSRAISYEILKIGKECGYDCKQPVAVYMEKCKEVLVSFMGIAYCGDFYSPIDVDMPGPRVAKIIETLKPRIVITTAALKEQFDSFGYDGHYIIYETAGDDPDSRSEETQKAIDLKTYEIIDTDILYVLFTSGSTGTPKGVSITHRGVIDYIDWVTEQFSVTSEDSFGNQAPFYFDNSILDIYSCMKMGAKLHIIPHKLFFQPVRLLEYLQENSISTIFWVPSAMIVVSKLKALKKVDLSATLKRILFCGEVMPNKQLNIWRSFLPDALYANLYGPTEITDACTFYIVDREFADDEALPIGRPMPNTEILVLDDDDKLVTGTDRTGELCVRGTGLAKGYYNNPEKTAAAFVQNPLNTAVPDVIYRTGDVVRYNEYGEIMYLSRKDFQIKHLGHRIELGEIETAVDSLDGISSCCCLYDEKMQKIVLFLDVHMELQDLRDKLAGMIPEYMIPGRVICTDSLPLNANGKIDRVKLKELL